MKQPVPYKRSKISELRRISQQAQTRAKDGPQRKSVENGLPSRADVRKPSMPKMPWDDVDNTGCA